MLRMMHNKMRIDTTNAQASLEMTIAIICVLVFLFSSIRLFAWINDRLVRRQDAFRDARTTPLFKQKWPRPAPVNETALPQLDMSVNVPK